MSMIDGITTKRRTSMNLEAPKFKAFMDVLKIVSASCKDIMIKNGQICQKSDDTRTVYKCDLSDVIGVIDMNITRSADVHKTLEIFTKQGSDVVLEFINGKFIFKDSQSSYSVINSLDNYITRTNRFMSDEEFGIVTFIDDVTPLCEGSIIDKTITDRFEHISRGMSVSNTILKFKGDSVEFLLTPSDEKNATIFSVFKIDGLEEEINGSGKMALDFVVNCSPPIDLSLSYRESKGRTYITLKSQFKIMINSPEHKGMGIDMEVWGVTNL